MVKGSSRIDPGSSHHVYDGIGIVFPCFFPNGCIVKIVHDPPSLFPFSLWTPLFLLPVLVPATSLYEEGDQVQTQQGR